MIVKRRHKRLQVYTAKGEVADGESIKWMSLAEQNCDHVVNQKFV